MKRGIKAQSEIISTILIILLVIVSMVVIYNVYLFYVRSSTEDVGSSDVFETSLEILDAKFYATGGGEVKIRRESGKGAVDYLKFIFIDDKGISKSVDKIADPTCNPNQLETHICKFTSNDVNFKVAEFSVVPVFENKNFGNEVKKSNPETNLPDPNDANLVAFWNFDGSYQDVSGNGNHGTKSGAPKIEGDVLVLNNQGLYPPVPRSDYIKIINIADFKFTGAFTISAWINLAGWDSADPDSTNFQIFKAEDNPNNGYALILMDSGSNIGKLQFRTNSAGSSTDRKTSSQVINPAIWYHVVIVVNDAHNDVDFYVDVSLKSDDNAGISNFADSAFVGIGGNGSNDAAQWFYGSIDNVMVFNKALTSSEIQTIYNNQKKS